MKQLARELPALPAPEQLLRVQKAAERLGMRIDSGNVFKSLGRCLVHTAPSFRSTSAKDYYRAFDGMDSATTRLASRLLALSDAEQLHSFQSLAECLGLRLDREQAVALLRQVKLWTSQ